MTDVEATPPAPRLNGSVHSETVIETRSASFGYNRVPVVTDLNLKVRAGEVVSVLGPNGAGKSTTILGLVGELSPLAGEVRWLGASVRTSLHVRARQGLSFVPEERSVIFGLSVRDNLRLGRGDIDTALEYAPELEGMLHRRAGLLSGGQQQILTLARALASKPRLLIADELSLGLAPLATSRLLAAARRAADHGVGVLLVEQHVRTALAVSDRAYVLRRGRVVLEGDAADLADRTVEIEQTYITADRDDDTAAPALGGEDVAD